MRVKLEKRGVLGAGQVKKGGSLPRHIPILNIYVSTPPPPGYIHYAPVPSYKLVSFEKPMQLLFYVFECTYALIIISDMSMSYRSSAYSM